MTAVDIGCTLDRDDNIRFDWDAKFANGERIGLFEPRDIGSSLKELLLVDAILRGQGVTFRTRNTASGEPLVTSACLGKLGPSRHDILRLMHQE